MDPKFIEVCELTRGKGASSERAMKTWFYEELCFTWKRLVFDSL